MRTNRNCTQPAVQAFVQERLFLFSGTWNFGEVSPAGGNHLAFKRTELIYEKCGQRGT